MSANTKVRVQLDLDRQEVAKLDSLIADCRLRSRSDAVRTALAVIDWASSEARAGRKVVALGEDLVSELVMPGVTR